MEEIDELLVNGKRVDGRRVDELRPLKIKAHVLNSADGSAYVEWGNNKVIAGVFGPTQCLPYHIASPLKAVIRTQYLMAPFSSPEEHGRSGPNRRSIEISKVMREALEHVVMVEKFPRAMIEVYVYVLQADGGTRCAATTAASVALADAGLPMRDMVAAVAVGKVGGEMVLDLNYIEDSKGSADMALAMTHRNKDILLMQMEGILTKEEVMKGVKMARNAIDKIHELQVKALKDVYGSEIEENLSYMLEM